MTTNDLLPDFLQLTLNLHISCNKRERILTLKKHNAIYNLIPFPACTAEEKISFPSLYVNTNNSN